MSSESTKLPMAPKETKETKETKSAHVPTCHSRFEPGPAVVLERSPLVPNLQLLKVEAPAVAAKIEPGQFIMIRTDEDGERIPLTVADWDRDEGWVSCVFMEVGTTTYKLGKLQAGDELATFVGPLGKALEIENWGTVICAGGCYGIACIYPIARALKEKGNRVISLVEGRSSFLLYWIERLESVSDQVLISTKDRSIGGTGYCQGMATEVFEKESVQRVIAEGCTFMMYQMAEATRPLGIHTVVSLNPVMIDGTGMCGACRVLVDGETKFACVDGPDFDAHLVDWDLLLSRRQAYLGPETESSEK